MDVIYEHVQLENAPAASIGGVKQALQMSDTSVLYTKIRAITADKITRNRTFYPTSELRGDNKSYGYISFVSPYPVPILREHRQADGLFSTAGEPLGRVIQARFTKSGDQRYVEVLAEITDPETIERVLSRRYLTVSIGCVPEAVECSVCGQDPRSDSCGHERGVTYELENGEQRMCYHIIRKPRMIELSFVNVPSDDNAMILSTDTKAESYSKVEHFVMRQGQMYSLSRWRVVESVWQNEEESMDANELMEFTTYGELYHLDPEDPDFDKRDESLVRIGDDLYTADEAKLTAAQRKRLPDSAFCGPNRSFPAHDRAHVLAGLRLLGRAKLSPAQKARVRACLIRKGRRLGMDIGDSDRQASLLLVSQDEVRAFYEPITESVVRKLLSSESVRKDEYALSLLRTALVGKVGSDVDTELFGESNPPIVAESELYPIVLVSETLDIDLVEAADAVQESGQTESEQTESEECRECKECQECKESQDGVESKECSECNESGSIDIDAEIEARIEKLVGKRLRLEELAEQYVESQRKLEATIERSELAYADLLEEYDELNDRYHRLLTEYASALAIQSGYPAVRGKSLDQAMELFSKRDDSFLLSLVEDLRSSVAVGETVVITDAKDPRIPQTETVPLSKSESSPSDTTDESKDEPEPSESRESTVRRIGDSLEIEEELDDTIFLLTL